MNYDTLARLLKYPHAAVFDKSPEPELALRVRNPAGLVWAIDGKMLKLEVGQDAEWNGLLAFDGSYDWGLTRREYSLTDKTVGELADELRADGHEVVFENPDMANRGARVLIAGSANQADTNGDHLQCFTSLLWTLMGAYAGEVAEAEYQSGQALRQMVMTQAEGEWLDVWANPYGVPRLPGETDAALQARIPKEVFRLRVNGLAIEQAVTDIASESVVIDEPWKRMFELNVSALSGSHHMQDGRFYTYHVIQPVGVEGADWSKVIPLVERNKAAGIEIYAPRVQFDAREVSVQPPVEYRIERGLMESRGAGIWGTNDQILGVMRLSDNDITLNHPVARREWMTHSEGGGFQTAQQIGPHRTIAMANIILSDGDALGEENAILGRGAERVVFDPEPMPSDLMYLSAYGAERVLERVEVVSTVAYAEALVNLAVPDPGEVAHTDTRSFASDEAFPLRNWVGAWGAYPWIPDWRVAGSVRTDTPE